MSKPTQKLILYFILFLLFFYALGPVIPTYGDDQIYKEILSGRRYIDWVIQLYQVWTGRIVLTSVLVYLLNVSIVIWRILNAFMLTLLVYSIVDLNNGGILAIIMTSLAIMLLPISILSSSVFWITGSLNYLWSVSAMLFLFTILRRFMLNDDVSNVQYLIGFLLSIFASNMEQTALVIVVFFGIIILYVYAVKKRYDLRIIGLWLFMIGGFSFMMIAPGNYLRLEAEILGLNPSFVMLDGYDKMMIGLNYTFNVMFDDLKIYLWLMNASILLINVKRKKNILFSLIPFLLISLKLMFDLLLRVNPYCRACNDVHYILFNFKYFEAHYFVDWIHLIPILIAFVYSVFTIITTFITQDSIEDSIFNMLILTSGVSSAVILGFSPTVNASGHRIFFLLSVHIILVMLYFVIHLIENIKSRWVHGILIVIGFLCLVRIVYTLATISEFVVIY